MIRTMETNSNGVPYDRHWPFKKIADTDPKYWWSLYRQCTLEEIADLDKKMKSKRNIAQRKRFEEVLAEVDQILADLDKA